MQFNFLNINSNNIHILLWVTLRFEQYRNNEVKLLLVSIHLYD